MFKCNKTVIKFMVNCFFSFNFDNIGLYEYCIPFGLDKYGYHHDICINMYSILSSSIQLMQKCFYQLVVIRY